ncbi:glycosyltransferase [Halobacterium salinarum]|nr:glycosyltransferase [Halobacterium salinarum]
MSQEVTLKSLGDIPHDEMPLYMNACDTVLITSIRESGPLTVKEAALCNTPIVTTNVGFTADTLSEVSNSYVCDSIDSLVDRLEATLCSDGETDGREQLIEDVGLERMGDRILHIYNQLLE